MGDIELLQDNGVLTIRMNRADKKNALTRPMYKAMGDALDRAATDSDVRVVLFQGAGGSFTAGYDLQEFLSDPPRGPDSEAFRFLETLVGFPKPLVAAVAGVAVGIGTTMLLHCDLVYAAADARLSVPFVGLGLCPEAGSSYLLPRLTGYARAAELLLLGEAIDASRAAALGLVTRVVPNDQLTEAAGAAARRLAALPARSVQATKLLMRAGASHELRKAMSDELETFVALLESPEAKEAFSAFLEKRRPDFTKFR